MYEPFTDCARKVMQLANQEAQRFNHEYIGTEHFLLGLIKEGSGVAAKVRNNLDIDLHKIRLEVEKLIQYGPDIVTMVKLPQTPQSKKIIEYSMEEARTMGHSYVGTEHMLIGILRVHDGIAAKVLTSLGMELEQVRTEVLNIRATYPELVSERSTQRTRPSPPHPSKLEAKTIKEKEPRPVTEEELASQREAMLTHTMRILDATFNRAMEGLRVTEDYVRFVLDDHHLTEALKSLRHDLLAIIETLPSADRFTSRDVTHDIGTEITTPGETDRQDLPDVFFANMQRARQSLRSLEEFVKLIEPHTAGQIEALRYRLYTIEKAVAVSYESEQRLQKISLCVLIDGMNTVAKFSELVEQLFSANVGMIQLRDDKLSDRKLFERAHALVSQSKKRRDSSRPPLPHTLTIINNRPDIAIASHADGVHLGQDDLTAKAARAILGPRKLIGISTHSIEQARRAVLDGANYLGAGPTFPSTTKSFDAFPGLDYLRQIATEISLPIFAIGGIQAENLAEVLETGVNRVAVSGAVAKAPDPGEAASKLMEILRGAATR